MLLLVSLRLLLQLFRRRAQRLEGGCLRVLIAGLVRRMASELARVGRLLKLLANLRREGRTLGCLSRSNAARPERKGTALTQLVQANVRRLTSRLRVKVGRRR